MKKWIIYYGDGSKFTWEDGTHFDAPRVNVQLIAVEDDDAGWILQSDAEYYYYDSDIDIWYIADSFAMYDLLIRCKHPLVFFGRYIHRPDFQEILKRCLKELPGQKSRWRRGKPKWLEGTD